MLQLTCPHCRRVLAVPPSAAGQVVACPLCGGHLTVPRQTAAFVVPEVQTSAPAFERLREREPEPEPEYRRESIEHEGFRCPYCRASRRPVTRSEIAVGGWVLMMVLLVMALVIAFYTCGFGILLTPLCLVGLFIRRRYRVCSACGIHIGAC